MATEEKQRSFKDFVSGASPIGIFVWPKLRKPDLRFEPEFGVYSVDLDLSGLEADQFVALIDKAFKDEYPFMCKRESKDKLKLYDGKPYKQATEGKEKTPLPGIVRFKFSRKAGGRYSPKHPSTPNEVWIFSEDGTGIPVYGAAGETQVHAEVWGGSKGRVSYTIVPWYSAALGYGVRLQLEAVKVLDLVSKGVRAAADYGFEDEEGYIEPPPAECEDDSFEGTPTTETTDELAPEEAQGDGIEF